MKKVRWIQFKTCDAISQLFLYVVLAIQVLAQKFPIYPGINLRIEPTMNHISGEKTIQPINNPYLYFIDWKKHQMVLEQI